MMAQTPAITLATSAAHSTRPTSTAWPALDPTLQPTSADISQPAEDASQSRKNDGVRQTQIRRAAWLHKAERARDLRKTKQASICEQSLRAATHAALKAEIEMMRAKWHG